MQPEARHLTLISRWLMLCALLVALMVLIGGLTRLTESGLSIVEWKLLSGIAPPLSEQGWQEEFTNYQTSPEYKKVNRHFSLGDFKRIFWLEYLHRVLGRIVGLTLLLPFVYFTARRVLPKPLVKRMALACVLVAAQGAVGWIMVASGLVDQPRVSPVKLALHLSLAFALFGLLLWTLWQVRGDARPQAPAKAPGIVRGFFVLVCVQVVLGALVAGLDAGYSYNTFPLMGGHLLPPDLYMKTPWWLNHLEHILMVQFQHRVGAYLVAGLAVGFVLCGWRYESLRPALKALLAVVILQFALGVATLLSVMNIALASAHQLGALLLFGVTLRLIWRLPSTKRAN